MKTPNWPFHPFWRRTRLGREAIENLIRFRHLIEAVPALIVHGHIERHQRSVNVIAERFEALTIVSDAERRVHNFG